MQLETSNIITINQIAAAKKIFMDADADTLVIFDVDCVLTMPSDPILQSPTLFKYQAVYEKMRKDLTKDERHLLNHLLVMHSDSQLVELEFPDIIRELQKCNIKTIAMTAGKTGLVGKNDICFPDWRYAELKQLGIDFSIIFPDKLYFTELADFNGDKPGIEHGIAYSAGNRNAKGDLLQYLFQAIQFRPKRVLAIDDRLKNLLSFSETLANIVPTIGFVGLHYLGSNFVSTSEVKETDFIDLISTLIQQIKELL